MAILYTLEKLNAKERFDYWHDVVCSTYAPAESRKLTEGPFDGSLNVKTMGDITLTQIKSLPVEYTRHRRDDERDQFLMSLSLMPGASFIQNGVESRQNIGDIVVVDSAQPYECHFPQGDNQIVVAVPRPLFLRHIPEPEAFLGRTLESQSPLGKITSNLLLEIWRAEPVSETTGDRLNGSFLDILSTAFESAFRSSALEHPAHQTRQLQRAKQYLLANLHDPELNIEHVASAIHVSPRTLNRLFAAEGTTATRWLWQERLAACHEALLKRQHLSVSNAALSHGFTNLSHFSRAFKNAYGYSAQQLLRRQ
ncbi:helix-turn-helix domain-containing protein [Pseudomonas syringae pv. syringae]|uniref:helix-turn-helix domain-containing protein n=1 Tax=Pseudomonas syringae TaxID=317 RepID=UPI0023F6B1AB|nr:helix-turn-helix domain-containing protein [Pseudomonas syringae]MDF5890343.1 helix-turn-helix domain-containing protein [Pseudomonas syringae pv. syringae]